MTELVNEPKEDGGLPAIDARFIRTAIVLNGWTMTQPKMPPRPEVVKTTVFDSGAGTAAEAEAEAATMGGRTRCCGRRRAPTRIGRSRAVRFWVLADGALCVRPPPCRRPEANAVVEGRAALALEPGGPRVPPLSPPTVYILISAHSDNEYFYFPPLV